MVNYSKNKRLKVELKKSNRYRRGADLLVATLITSIKWLFFFFFFETHEADQGRLLEDLK